MGSLRLIILFGLIVFIYRAYIGFVIAKTKMERVYIRFLY